MDAPEIEIGSEIYVLYKDRKWYHAKVIEMDSSSFVICRVQYTFDKTISDYNILPEHFRPNHNSCDSTSILGTNSPYWAYTAPGEASSESDERRYGIIRAKLNEIHENEKILQSLEARAAEIDLQLSLDSSRSHDDAIDDGTAFNCCECKKMLTEHTGMTTIDKLHTILEETENKSDLDMSKIMAGEKKTRVSLKNPLRVLEMCKGCIAQSTEVNVVLSSQNSKWLCQWCRAIYSSKSVGFQDNLCEDCEKSLIKIEKSKGLDRAFLNRGLRPLKSLLAIDAGGEVVREKNKDIDATISLGKVNYALEIDTNHEGSKPEYKKDKKNIKALHCLTKSGNKKLCVHIRINPLKKYNKHNKSNTFTPLLRWLALRDLIVMLYRMFEKNEFLDVDDPIFYMFYKADSKLIDTNRKPYLVHSAVSLPSELLQEEPRRFADWECMVDPLLPHYSKQTHMLLQNRTPLDKLERPTGF